MVGLPRRVGPRAARGSDSTVASTGSGPQGRRSFRCGSARHRWLERMAADVCMGAAILVCSTPVARCNKMRLSSGRARSHVLRARRGDSAGRRAGRPRGPASARWPRPWSASPGVAACTSFFVTRAGACARARSLRGSTNFRTSSSNRWTDEFACLCPGVREADRD